MGRPKLLATGFGPFPGAAENPTEALARHLSEMPASAVGAATLEAIVLPTDFRRGWSLLRATLARTAPDIVVHFGLSSRAAALMVETRAKRRTDPAKPDCAGQFVKCGYAVRPGPEALAATFRAHAIVAALNAAGHPAALSDDAGDYVCNFVLYRSLNAACGTARQVGFIHVPPIGRRGMTAARLIEAAAIALQAATADWPGVRLPGPAEITSAVEHGFLHAARRAPPAAR
jgi:pyroglutamyl-peptidase